MMAEHIQAIGGLLRELHAALDTPDPASVGPPQLKALQDISEILRECQQFAFSSASELIREMDSRPSDAKDASSDDE